MAAFSRSFFVAERFLGAFVGGFLALLPFVCYSAIAEFRKSAEKAIEQVQSVLREHGGDQGSPLPAGARRARGPSA